MNSQSLVIDEINSPLKLLQLDKGFVNMKILHVGSIPAFMNHYLIKNRISKDPVDHTLKDSDIDIILVNGEQSSKGLLRGSLRYLRPVVTYTKNYSESIRDDVPFALIPILIKYLIKIKESIKNINKQKSLDNAEKFLQRVTNIIDEHIDDHSLNMKKLSNLVYMSRSSFSKKIKSYTGLKPTEFINHYKLEKSKHLLLVTNWQISKIADQLGFCSQQYYCRLFKKEEGINPSKFRKKFQNNEMRTAYTKFLSSPRVN